MKQQSTFGPDDSGPIDVALQRPTVNAEQGEKVQAESQANPLTPILSRHAKFGPRVITHPGIEN
jgi:hypothetical protein